MEFNYQQIKTLAKELGRPVTDLIALASQNDPFYQGTPASRALAEWFAEMYYGHFGAGTRVHIRRCHYAVLSLGLILPNGKPYENTQECWETLLMASKAARYLKLVDITAFEDRKNDEAEDYSNHYMSEPAINVATSLYSGDLQLPDFPELPSYSVDSFNGNQRYHIELWCEKSTMNDILVPLCQRYDAVLQYGAGELSITATAQLAERIKRSGKPARIFYISDFDPAGQSMPVAISRKLEYFVRGGLDADIRLFPVVLTAEQVRRYSLPRTPIKESEKRRGHFEEQHGQGAVELDALEALQPGVLRRILRAYIERYYDVSLAERARQERLVLERDLQAIRQGVINEHADEIAACRAELEAIQRDMGPRMDAYSAHLQEVWQAVSDDLESRSPDVDEYPVPEAEEAEEVGSGLYNSERDYLDQINVYKSFQGKQ